MAAGGIYDQIGGGFCRYSTDEKWLVPHFEKMLYDNAQLLNLFLDAYLVSGKGHFADVARDIIRYIRRDMTHRSDQLSGSLRLAQDIGRCARSRSICAENL